MIRMVCPAAPNGLYAESLAVLDAAEGKGQIKDRLGLLEARGRLLLAQRQFNKAEQIYRYRHGATASKAGFVMHCGGFCWSTRSPIWLAQQQSNKAGQRHWSLVC